MDIVSSEKQTFNNFENRGFLFALYFLGWTMAMSML